MTWWSADFWNNIGPVGLSVLACVFFVVALVRGWLVIGRYHRETVERLDARAQKDAETIDVLSRTITEKVAEDQATTRILSAIRDLWTSSKEGAT